MKTKTANVVIGANFGDEGKGLVTDFLSAPYGSDSLVIRHNGGAQAGHTVQTADGKRHIYSHFGSGSFAGAATFLSRFFVANPILYFREKAKLVAHGLDPTVYIDAACPVTTPYDMMINQIVEETRGAARHGSVGVGFGETLERNLNPACVLSFSDLAARAELQKKLRDIRGTWIPQRLKALGVADLSDEWQRRLSSDGILEHFVEDCGRFCESVQPAGDALLKDARHICFEGAQGLLLDQDRGWFPHVTRSNTGIRNAAILAKEAGIEQLNVYYATRAYATRHGAGPLPHACDTLPYPRISDPTNVKNDWQGALRFGWLDMDLLRSSIFTDLKDSQKLRIAHHLMVSCMDQVAGPVRYIKNGESVLSTPDAFLADARCTVEADTCLASYGPTRETMRNFHQPARTNRRVFQASAPVSGAISLRPGISSSVMTSPSTAI